MACTGFLFFHRTILGYDAVQSATSASLRNIARRLIPERLRVLARNDPSVGMVARLWAQTGSRPIQPKREAKHVGPSSVDMRICGTAPPFSTGLHDVALIVHLSTSGTEIQSKHSRWLLSIEVFLFFYYFHLCVLHQCSVRRILQHSDVTPYVPFLSNAYSIIRCMSMHLSANSMPI
jgi:hypothetical protein